MSYVSWYGFIGKLLRALRSPQDEIKQPANNCRKWTNNGDVAVCDENVEIRNLSIDALNEARDNLIPVICGPDDVLCDEDDFDRKWNWFYFIIKYLKSLTFKFNNLSDYIVKVI